MNKKIYVIPTTEIIRSSVEPLMLSASVYNGNPNNPAWEESIGAGGSVTDGDFAKEYKGTFVDEDEDKNKNDVWL